MLVSIILIWSFYNNYSDNVLHKYIGEIEDDILVAVVNEDWEAADKSFDELSSEWHKYKKWAAFFFRTAVINEADYSIAKAKHYIKAKDVSNASGELACLKEQLTFMHYNESLKLDNIL